MFSGDDRHIMGKLCTNRYLGGTMRIVMCEQLDVTALPRLLEMQDRAQNDCIQTLNILENNDDVEALKLRAQARENLPETTDHTVSMAPSNIAENSLADSFMTDMKIDSDVSIYNGDRVGSSSCHHTVHNGCHDRVNGSDVAIDNVTDTTTCDRTFVTLAQSPNCDATSESGTLNDTSPGDGRGNKNTSQSRMSTTQDLSVNVSSCNNRLSRVLENIPLVYIPTTKQLGLITTEPVASQSQTPGSQITASLSCSNAIDSVGADEQKHYRHCESVSINDEEHDLHIDCAAVSSRNDRILERDNRETRQSQKHDSLKSDKTDASSFSSIISSTGTELSLSAVSAAEDSTDLRNALLEPEDAEFMEINLHSRNSYEPTRGPDTESDAEENGAKSRKKPLSGFRNLFSRKPKDVVNSPYQSAPGWKLFGRIPPKQSEKKEASQILEEYQAKQRSGSINDLTATVPHIKKQDIEVLSTTALILENRPMNLPSKCPEEEQRHRLEYEAMVDAARKKEVRELRQKKKHLQQLLKQEDKRVASAKFWNSEILPNWEQMHNNKKTRELWWLGLPPNIRGKVWKLAIGNDLNLTAELYEICLSRAQERLNLLSVENGEPSGPSETSSEPPSSKEASVELIKLDVARTFPQLCIFQKGGPYYDLLHSLLGAYACYRPDVGYVQGMSFIAAVLLLNMDVAEAFICFANLLNRPCQVAFFRMDESMMKSYFQTFEEFFRENMPKLHKHFVQLSITPDVYIIDWIFTLFSKSLPLDVACRVWDIFCRDGEEFLFRTALGLLKMYEEVLLNLDFIHLAQFMTRLPEVISGDALFKCIDSVKMTIDKKRFAQVMAAFREVKES